ncbi:choice-of-anchor J domain-containing protein [Prolixibacter sp. NT017]|uniref:choice-of-anchor J domain-containing protein n=1 Tax=Prolixibacter sp. NT017 TaxID=2652390 RepID=UPI00127588C4|nr:choice-of-anchor J domain-containing protein [Prolixibacter sp. NT017]GET27128.1 DUF5017 domain-containing protein [Prolixibacter sp. NT017]
MNKLYKFLIIIAVALAGCNPMEDINNQLDQQKEAPTAEFEYTLSDADYSTISSEALAVAANKEDSTTASYIKSSLSLPEGFAADYVPAVLKSLHPALGKNSVAKVAYNFNNGPKAYLAEYTDAGTYYLQSSDYAAVGGEVKVNQFFSPSYPPEEYLPALLAGKYSDAADGTLKMVTYKYAQSDNPEGSMMNIFKEDFSGSLGDFQTFSVAGDQSWYAASYSSDEYAKMSGYSGGAQVNEDWLVSPAIDLSDYASPNMQITQAINYLNDQWDQISVLVSTDYNGTDISTATWNKINISTLPTGSNWDFVTSERVSLSDYAGQTIYIALKYTSSDTNAATWEVDQLVVSGIQPKVSFMSDFYQLNDGTWAKDQGAYVVNPDDYDAMGAPGKYNNFSSSDNPDDYLPQLLSIKYPYAQDGDKLAVVYKYYSGGTSTRADEYSFSMNEWTKYDPIEVKTDQFINVGSKWIFDPTVKFTMSSADYQLVVDAVKANPDTKNLVDSYGTGEFYYGANSHYNNFDLRIVKRTTGDFTQSEYADLSEEDASALIMQRVAEGVAVMLKAKFPNAVAQVSGVDVMYIVTFSSYENDGSYGKYTVTFQCTKSGPDPSFELVEGPTPVE